MNKVLVNSFKIFRFLLYRPPLMPRSTLWRDPFPDWGSRSTIWPAKTTISMASRLDWLRRISIFSTRCRNWTLPMPASPKPNLNFKSKSMTWRETWMTRAGYERVLLFFVFSLKLQARSTYCSSNISRCITDKIFFYSNARTCKFSSVPSRVTTTTWTPAMRKNLNPPPTSVPNSAVSTPSSPPSRLDMTKNFLPRPRRWKKWGKKYWFLERIEF